MLGSLGSAISQPTDRSNHLALPLDKTEAMSERIAAESSRPMFGTFENLLLLCASSEGPRQSRLKIVDMNVEMYGRPVTLVVARLFRVSRSPGACPFFEQRHFGVPGAEHRHAGYRYRGLGESKGSARPTSKVDINRQLRRGRLRNLSAPSENRPSSTRKAASEPVHVPTLRGS